MSCHRGWFEVGGGRSGGGGDGDRPPRRCGGGGTELLARDLLRRELELDRKVEIVREQAVERRAITLVEAHIARERQEARRGNIVKLAEEYLIDLSD